MEIWLDTVNVQAIQQANQFGILAGITTNPSIIADAKRDLEKVLEELLHSQEGPVTAQVIAQDTKEMVQQGQNLFSFSNRLIIKVPVTKQGLEAIHLLSRQGIATMGTVVFHPQQALMAALAGADYVAPYLGRMEKGGKDPWQALTTMLNIFKNYRLRTKILGASIHYPEQVIQCAEIGIDGVTVREDVFEKIVENDSLTIQSVQKFTESWKDVRTGLFK
jgi:transaldolase